MESYSLFKFNVFKEYDKTWNYVVYEYNRPIRVGSEYFENPQEARIGAKHHIDLLENGED